MYDDILENYSDYQLSAHVASAVYRWFKGENFVSNSNFRWIKILTDNLD